MPRKNKVNKVVGESSVPTATVEAPVKSPYSLKASFYTKDAEGAKILKTFESTGDTVDELLANLAFPKGTNCLVKVSVQKGDKRVDELSLSPVKAQLILYGKDSRQFRFYFGNI